MSDRPVRDDTASTTEATLKVIRSLCTKQNADGEQVTGEPVGNSKGVGGNRRVPAEKLMSVAGHALFIQTSGDKDIVERIFHGF